MTVCTVCRGEKTVLEYVQWSDGLGGINATCPLCLGKGELTQSLETTVIQERERANVAEAALNQLKVHVKLYLSTSKGMTPNPPLQGASGPSPYPDTWLMYLERATANLPRCNAKDTEELHGYKRKNGEPISPPN